MKKMCSVCKKLKDISKFSKDKNGKLGLSFRCKSCRKQAHLDNKEKNNAKNREYYRNNKKEIWLRHKKYAVSNKITLLEYRKKYEKVNKQCRSEYKKRWYKNTIKDRLFYRKTNAKYETYKDKLTVDESPKLSIDGVSLEVKCRYCGKYFIPTNESVRSRLMAIKGIDLGENSLYCSNNCKESCPVFRQRVYPKGFKKATSREVNPYVRQLCFERDDWTCQKCGATQEDAPLHCHHIEGYAQNPRLGNDVGNTITLCKECHKKVHKLPGCGYYELRCSTEDNQTEDTKDE